MSFCRTCALNATDSHLKNSFRRFCDTGRKKRCNSVCGLQWTVRVDGSEQSLGHPSRTAEFRAHAAPQEMCDNLINALNFWSNQQIDGDSPVTMAVQGFQERIRLNVIGRLRRFIIADYFEVVKVCYFGKKKTWSRGMCKQYTCLAHVSLMRILSACLSQLVVTVAQAGSRTDLTHSKAQRITKTVTHHRAMSCVTPHLTTPSTDTPSLFSAPHGYSFLIFDTTSFTSTSQRA